MNIMIVLPHIRTGGGEHLALDEALYLNKINNTNVLVVSLKPREDNIYVKYAEDNIITVKYLNKRENNSSIFTIFEFLKVLKEFKPDVLSTHLRVLPYVFLPAMLCNVQKKFHTIHTLADKDADGLLKKIQKICFNFGGFIPVAISDYCQKSIVEFYNLKKDYVPVVYNGIDIERFFCSKEYKLRSSNKIRIISTGRFEKIKRHDLMIDCFETLKNMHSNIELVFLGDGEEFELMKKRVAEKQIDSIQFRGSVMDVEKQLNNAHIYLMASDYEGLPLSVLEAMSCGLPVVCTKAGGTVDIVNEDVGILCDCGDKNQIVDALNKLISNQILREKLSENAVIWAKQFSMENCAKKYAKLFGVIK